MSDTDMRPAAEPDPATIAEIKAQLVALRAAGMLSPEGCRLLARAEAVEVANREMAGVRQRLEDKLKQIDTEAKQAKRELH